jgi:hypothetical protein
MRHARHIVGEIYLALVRATLSGSEDTHVDAFARSGGKHDSRLASARGYPTGGAHREPVARSSAEDRHGPGVRNAHRVGDARAVRRKCKRPHFGETVVRELHWLAIGHQFDIDLAVSDERGVPTDESQHAAVRRKRRGHRRIGEVGELEVFRGSGAWRFPGANEDQAGTQQQHDDGESYSQGAPAQSTRASRRSGNCCRKGAGIR